MFSDIYDVYLKSSYYAAQPEKYMQVVGAGNIRFKGFNAEHSVKMVNDVWTCDCAYYTRREASGLAPYCSHTIAVEKAKGYFVTLSAG